ncbi:alpha/beta hydrolase [Parvularcula sp. ZS-1/3]|uniref:Alpha/beta hydrolase n=1 Tax=Parvularcula mediterranea TaxID=2732508 RepID=A0A7Y3RLI1_9PROT|nr:alpha/beta hydrolase [Parvularcula mediterranea]NNU16210.1 alpha/beta hydrolase [Parvularcula mediterranea]
MEAPQLPDEGLLHEEEVRIRSFSLKLRIWGDRSKPLVILQHGGKDHGRSWDWTVARLLDHYCVAVPDLRGHGDSDWSPSRGYDTMDYVTDMAFVVEHLKGMGFAPPFHFVGHSLGGNIVLHHAAAQPGLVRSLTAIEGLGFSQSSLDDRMKTPTHERMAEYLKGVTALASKQARQVASVDVGARRLRSIHPDLPEEMVRHLARHNMREEGESFVWKPDPLLGVWPPRPIPPAEYMPVYASIGAPILVMYGDKSWATNPAEDGRMDQLPGAELISFEDAGHWLHHDRFEDFIGHLRRFLEAHP